jgi:amidase
MGRPAPTRPRLNPTPGADVTDPTALAALDATAQAELVATGECTPTELVDAAITRIEATDPTINAVIHPLFERARARAAAPVAGPFSGVPMVVKDLDGQLAGAPLHLGNKLLKEIGYTAPDSSYLFDKLEQAGFVIVGKTAAAVASGMVPVGHAGDGGGSIRIPSSECGLVGLKPSRGRVSLGPQDGEVWNGLVARHVVTHSVRDSAAILDLLAGEMPGDPYTAPPPAQPFAGVVDTDPRPLRIGLRTDAIAAMCEVDTECAAAAEAAAKTLESLGHTVEIASPDALDESELVTTFLHVVAANALGLVEELATMAGRAVTADDVEPGTWSLAEAGRAVTAVQYQQTLAAAHAWTRRVLGWWHAEDNAYDVLLTPTLAALPPVLGTLNPVEGDPAMATILQTPYAAFAAAFNVTGQPAMSVPVAMSDGGLPIGVQLVGAAYHEDLLLALAGQLERAAPWAARRPQIFAG